VGHAGLVIVAVGGVSNNRSLSPGLTS